MNREQHRSRLVRQVAALSGASAVLVGGTLGFAGIAAAAYPGTNGLIAFTSTRDNGGAENLFLLSPATATGSASSDTSAVQPLTNTESDDNGPFFSPDGKTVVFFSDRDTGFGNDGGDQIWTVPTGNVPTTEDTTGGTPGADGARLYYNDPDNSDTWPSFAPDGKTIAFNQANSAVIVVDPLASSPTPINVTDPGDPPANNGRPVFDPVDATKLVYADGQHHLILVSGIGGTLSFTDLSASTIGSGADEFPDFSPDGTHIVFDSTRALPGTTATTSNSQIWVMQSNGANPAPFFTPPTGSSANTGYTDTEPAFSPDGSRITFQRAKNGTDVDDDEFAPAGSGYSDPMADVTDATLTLTGSPKDISPDWQSTATVTPVLPESPLTAGLPIAGAVLVGGSYLVLRRRSAKA